ncbi:hypothetical protein ACFQX9_16115 [Bradyrhizobium sp. GCM10028915]|jgi:hypothetical protein|uniref:hypothetical protein n=1 Tax=Bradyrhizobium sp. GCM10028915 TaxID=3273385 RepID=UPI0036114263
MLAASLLEILDLDLPTTGAPALAVLLESARKKTGVLSQAAPRLPRAACGTRPSICLDTASVVHVGRRHDFVDHAVLTDSLNVDGVLAIALGYINSMCVMTDGFSDVLCDLFDQFATPTELRDRFPTHLRREAVKQVRTGLSA